MKRKARVASSRTVEFLPRRFFFVALRETERVTLHQQQPSTPSPSSSPSIPRSRALPVTPGVRYISLDDQLAAADARSELRDTILFCDFLTSFTDGSTRSANTVDASSAHAAAEVRVEGVDRRKPPVHYFYLRSPRIETETRVIHLICRWRLLHLRLPPLEAVAPFEHLMFLFPTMVVPLSATRASRCRSPPNLLVSLQGIAKGLRMELLDSSTATSGLDALRHLVDQQQQERETAECGTMVWITRQLVVVVAAPLSTETQLQPSSAEATPPPDAAASDSTECAVSEDLLQARQSATRHLVSMLKHHHVATVVRLHRLALDDPQFAASGIELVDLTATPAELAPPPPAPAGDRLEHFLRACEGALAAAAASIVAIHASAGSGTVAAFVGCYLMKHLEFTSREAFGWLHACQLDGLAHTHQVFLDHQQRRMWRDGAEFRRLTSEDDESDAAASPLHINIGNISLGQHSLFGTKASTAAGHDRMIGNGHAPRAAASRASTSREPHTPVVAQDPHEPTSSLASATQLKRRPLTQGSVGRRPRIHSYHRSGEGVHLRADFAQMHKFLHQTGSVSSLSTAATSRPREAASAAAGGGGHTSESVSST